MKNKKIIRENSAMVALFAYYFCDEIPEIAFKICEPVHCRILIIEVELKENSNENIQNGRL